MQTSHNCYNYHTFSGKIYFSLIRVLKIKKKKVDSVKHHWMIHENSYYNSMLLPSCKTTFDAYRTHCHIA